MADFSLRVWLILLWFISYFYPVQGRHFNSMPSCLTAVVETLTIESSPIPIARRDLPTYLARMSYVKSFSARYGDEGTVYEQLAKIFPMVTGIAVIVSKQLFL